MDKKLSTLRVAQLKHIQFLSGCTSSSTTKITLQQNLGGYLSKPLFNPHNGRILSVDMGIRNLAYCVIEPTQLESDRVSNSKSPALQVKAWKKIDLLEQIKAGHEKKTTIATDGGTDSADSEKTVDIFKPSIVSKIAYQVTSEFLSHRPSTILIERQRFRSRGGSAVQEWTLRVNMLESMLWSCLTTMQQLQVKDVLPNLGVHGVSPARVAKFWIGSQSGLIKPSQAMLGDKADIPDVTVAKTTKQDRMNILQSWLQHPDGSAIKLDFENDAAKIAEGFQIQKKRGSKEEKQKLDDLTDCLLQAAAWYQWEVNRRAIMGLLVDSRSKST